MKVPLTPFPAVCMAGLLLALVPPLVTGAHQPLGRPAATPGAVPEPSDLAAPPDFPAVGKWMYTATGDVAGWLGEVFRGKRLREPINVLVVDRFAASAEDAKWRFIVACMNAGYPARNDHSSGYQGFIGNAYFPQLPEQGNHAFSNGPFELDNNHGRVFGPAPMESGNGATKERRYCFIAAFSRENVDPVTKIKHRYASFNRGRDDFAQRMDEVTQYKITDFVWLDNAVIGDAQITTGDHDGKAVLLSATR